MSLFGPEDVVFITGAASGIGRATALQFVADGIRKLALIDYSDLTGTQQAITEKLKNADIKSISVKADVSKPEDVEQAIKETVDTFGRIDYCVNSAGIGGEFGPIVSQEFDNLDKVLSVNLKGIWLCERAQIQQFLKQDLRPLNTELPFKTRGSIINIASVLGQVGMPALGPYVISKHGILGMVKTDALEYAKDGIRINAMCPGFVLTNLVSPEMWKSLDPVIALTPMQRLSTAEEIAFSTTFLSSDRSSYTTGSLVNVDGGYTAQ